MKFLRRFDAARKTGYRAFLLEARNFGHGYVGTEHLLMGSYMRATVLLCVCL